MDNPLEELVRLVAYMFYEPSAIMVLLGLLECESPMTVEELMKMLKFNRRDLDSTLSTLRSDGLVRAEEHEDLTGIEDPDGLSERQRKNLRRDYYAIDYKSFVDSVNLKIRLVLDELQERCGPADNIYYQCVKCNRKILLADLLMCDNGEFKCLSCRGDMIELDDSDEINMKRQQKNQFLEMTKPLLDLIEQTECLVMINDPDERCKSNSMIDKNEYIERKDYTERMKRTPKIHQTTTNTAALLKHSSSVKVVLDNGIKTQQTEIKNMKQFVEKVKEPSQEVEKKTITINGKEYTAEEITEELLDSLPESEFDSVMNFREQNL